MLNKSLSLSNRLAPAAAPAVTLSPTPCIADNISSFHFFSSFSFFLAANWFCKKSTFFLDTFAFLSWSCNSFLCSASSSVKPKALSFLSLASSLIILLIKDAPLPNIFLNTPAGLLGTTISPLCNSATYPSFGTSSNPSACD